MAIMNLAGQSMVWDSTDTKLDCSKYRINHEPGHSMVWNSADSKVNWSKYKINHNKKNYLWAVQQIIYLFDQT